MSSFKLKANGSPAPAPDMGQVRRAVGVFVDPDNYVFLQTLPTASWVCLPGAETTAIANWVEANATGKGLYFGINPVCKLDKPSRVADVVCRRWILIDVDRNKALKPLDPATEAEHEDAGELTYEVQSYLSEIGFPAPVQIDSANGFHLYYRVDLPNDEVHRDLVHNFLKILDNTFSGAKGAIGEEVFDARRISRMPGTWSRRGDASKDRPYRMAKFVYAPKEIGIVPTELLRRVVDDYSSDAAKEEGAKGPKLHVPVSSAAEENTPAPTPASSFSMTAKPEADRNRLYGMKALDQESAKLAACPEKGRHNQLVKSAYALWNLCAGGCLTAAEVKDALFIAACNCGLDKDKDHGGEAGILKQIESCREKGMSQPRNATSQDPAKEKKSKEKEQGRPDVEKGNKWVVEMDGKTVAEGDPDYFNKPLDFLNDTATRTFRMFTMAKLMATDFPEPAWVIPGVLSEGLNLLAGKPKQGKSMMALNLAITIAGGGKALGDIQTTPGDVLYISLEDKARRVKSRAHKMLKKLSHHQAAQRLTIATDWPRQDEGGLSMVDYWFKSVTRPVLVIIDVWGVFKTPYRQGGSQYEQDGQQLGAVKKFVDARGCSALVLLHCRKGASDDVLEEVSGTMGISGAADGIIVLNRIRNDKEARIFITGRDVPEKELALEFDEDSLTWKSMGTMDEHVNGKLQTAVMDYLRKSRGIIVFAKQISEALDVPGNSIRKTLDRLREKGFVCQKGHGWLYPVEVVDGSADEDDADGF